LRINVSSFLILNDCLPLPGNKFLIIVTYFKGEESESLENVAALSATKVDADSLAKVLLSSVSKDLPRWNA
jgi:hypothetical protein